MIVLMRPRAIRLRMVLPQSIPASAMSSMYRAAPVSLFFMLMCGVCVLALWRAPIGTLWLTTMILLAAGFFLYGPQALVAVIVANRATARPAGHTLAVDNPRAGFRLAPHLDPPFGAQCIGQLFPDPGICPAAKAFRSGRT